MTVVLGAALPAVEVLIPEVGRGRERPAVRTIGAARRIGRLLQELAADRLALLLPAIDSDDVQVLIGREGMLRRGFDELDAPDLVRVDRVDLRLVGALNELLPAHELVAVERADAPVAALAPLYFLAPAATLPLTILTVPPHSPDGGPGVGAAIREAAARVGGRTAVCAAGELSSRLFPGAPGGYHEAAAAFDQRALELLRSGGPGALSRLATDERATAGDTLTPQLVALGDVLEHSLELLLSYEAPFGVGFLAAAWSAEALDRSL